MEEKSLTVTNQAIVMPAVSADEAVKAFNAYQELAKRITTKEDIQAIQGKDFKKKSFWRKCQRFFNLSLELVSERKEENKGAYTYFVMYRATAPNGSHCDGDGACTSNEKGKFRTEHDTRATAHTRSKNRAISDLVAFGEVSAEEIEGEYVNENASPKTSVSTTNTASIAQDNCPVCHAPSGKQHASNCTNR